MGALASRRMSLPENPRAVVTGAASGLGRAFAIELGRRAGHVVVADIQTEQAAETARLVREAGGRAEVAKADVAKLEEVEGLLRFGEEHFGGVDLIVNNAGVAVAGPVGEIPIADWRWIVDINLLGVVHGCHIFVPYFRRRGSGHVLNVASAAGLISSPEMAPYNMTKAAVVALSETLAGELVESGVGVTVLCPTFFKTNIAKAGRTAADPGAERLATALMERAKLKAEDVARLALAGADSNTLYVVPMADGRWMWRFSRLVPELFYRTLTPWAAKKLRAKLGAR